MMSQSVRCHLIQLLLLTVTKRILLILIGSFESGPSSFSSCPIIVRWYIKWTEGDRGDHLGLGWWDKGWWFHDMQSCCRTWFHLRQPSGCYVLDSLHIFPDASEDPCDLWQSTSARFERTSEEGFDVEKANASEGAFAFWLRLQQRECLVGSKLNLKPQIGFPPQHWLSK